MGNRQRIRPRFDLGDLGLVGLGLAGFDFFKMDLGIFGMAVWMCLVGDCTVNTATTRVLPGGGGGGKAPHAAP